MNIRFGQKNMRIGAAIVSGLLLIGALGWFLTSGGYRLKEKNILVSEIIKISEPGEAFVSQSGIKPQQMCVTFSVPSSKLDHIGEPLEKGISIYPAIRGKWYFSSPSVLCFSPETDWLPGTEYQVSLGKEIFSENVEIKQKNFSFSSPVFSGHVVDQEFYEDPRNMRHKAAVATFRFNYPVNTQNLKDKISVQSIDGQKYDFTYKLSDFDTLLHVMSAPLQITKEVNFVNINVSQVENIYNKKTLSDKATATVEIPSSSTFFRILSADSSIVREDENEADPQQILALRFSTVVRKKDLLENMKLYFSDQTCSEFENQTKKIQKPFSERVKPLVFQTVPNAEETAKVHMFQYDLDVQKGCLFTDISQNLKSVEGFELGQDFLIKTSVSPYPKEVDFALDGAVLSLTGHQRATFVSRGVKELKVNVARFDAADLNHFVTQTGGRFEMPYFKNYYFNEDNISEVFEKRLPINVKHPSEANYASLDLSEYFQDKKGIFLIRVMGGVDDQHSTDEIKRLIVITDLGIVVKDNLDKTHNVFISNIATGEPVSGALVEVLGKNGVPVLQAETDAQGLALIKDFSDFQHEKEASVYKVSYESDVSFLPIDRYDRRMDLSRFNVGGEYVSEDREQIKAYIFNDRGIYRPGEKVHFGFIVRQTDLNVPQKLPLRVEIENPAYDVVASQNIQTDEAGFFAYSYTLPLTAQTGRYRAVLKLKDKDGQKRFVAQNSFQVEEFMPDSLRMTAEWNPKAGQGWLVAKEVSADVSLYNLYGNPAAAHELKAAYHLVPTRFYFEPYARYSFQDPLRQNEKTLQSYHNDLAPQYTTNEGKGHFTLDLSDFEQGTYRLQLMIDGLESGGGRGVSTVLQTLVSPNQYLVGWKSDAGLRLVHKNSDHQIHFIAVDHNLCQIEKKDLYLSLTRRQYVSSLIEMENGTYRYQMVPKEQIISKHGFKIDQKGTFEKLKTDEPGEYILSLEDQAGRVLARVEYNVSGSANLSYSVDKDAGLGLKLDHTEYRAGDEIKMQITAPYQGYGLITIERDKVYAFKWFKAQTTSVDQSIVLPEGVEGNAYINVAFFRDIRSREIYMPSMSYAAVPFSISKSDRELDVALEAPEVIKPGSELQIKYKTAYPAKLIVYGVNQGILQVAGYQMPDPLNAFLKKKALRVITSQIMDLIMPDIQILRTLSSSGGDGGSEEDALEQYLNPFARRSKQPVAFWSGILESDETGGIYTYNVPEEFNGEIKIMAVAVSEKRYGSTSQAVLSRGDFALVPSGPLNVSPGDEFVVSLSIGNLVKNSGNDFDVQINLNAGDAFEVLGETTQVIKISENSEKKISFRLKTLPKIGSKVLIFEAKSLQDQSKISKMPYTIGVRPSNPFGSQFAMGFERSSYRLQDVEKLYPEHRLQQVSASSSPMVLASGLIKYLDKFPHWCTEQTISKVFPAMEVFFKHPELVKDIDVYALFDEKINLLGERQMLNGGFRAWHSSSLPADKFASVYAAHFLVEAEKHGFHVPENILQNALSYCKTVASNSPSDLNDIIPAYATYVLTLHGEITTNYLLNLEQYYQKSYSETWKSKLPATLMSAAYKLLQSRKKAEDLFGQYDFSNGTDTENAFYIYLQETYFSANAQKLSQENIKALLKPLNEASFNTQSAAFSILALNAAKHFEDDRNIVFSKSPVEYLPFPTVDFDPQTTDLTVKSDHPFYYVVTQQGYLEESNVSALSDGIEITKAYYDKNKQQVQEAKLGEELTVKLIYRSLTGKPVYDVAFVDLLPGCFEVVENSVWSSGLINSSQVREDRVIVHATAKESVREITYKVRAIAQGKFIVPPVFASALYQPLIRANSSSGEMIVRE